MGRPSRDQAIAHYCLREEVWWHGLMLKLGRTEAELERIGALWTAREIAQQPAMLRKTHERLIARKDSVEAFLGPLLDRPATRVILAGAGTSSFIGECLAP